MWEKVHSSMQIAGAALAIPAALAGTYTAYHTYFSHDVACSNLQGAILTVMERNIAADIKIGLLRKDVADFGKMCGKSDPDSLVIFEAALKPPSPLQSAPSPIAVPPPMQTAAAGPAQSLKEPPVSDDKFGRSPDGQRRGWVALLRHEPGKEPESHFNEYAVTDKTLPAPGARLTARRLIPVWMEPLPPGPNPPEKLQGRLAAGGCVLVISTKPGRGRNWAEVAPVNCS